MRPVSALPRGFTIVTLGLAAVLLSASPAAAAVGPPPSSMASMGDSISRGFNACGFYVDCTVRSFSTGSDGAVNSQYLRLRARHSALAGHGFNDARSGGESAARP